MSKSEIETVLVYGVDEKNRRIYFGHSLGSEESHEQPNGDFTQTSVGYAVRALMKMASDKPKTPIEIHMNSFGGDVYSMLYLKDVILSLPGTCQIKFYGGGAVMSSATFVMAVCDERYLYEDASVMVHEGDVSISGKVTDNYIAIDEDKRLESILLDIYAKNTRMGKDFWETICKRDAYLTAQEAVLLGLADGIVPKSKRGNVRRKRRANLSKKANGLELHRTVTKIYKKLRIPVKPGQLVINKMEPDPIEEIKEIETATAETNDNSEK